MQLQSTFFVPNKFMGGYWLYSNSSLSSSFLQSHGSRNLIKIAVNSNWGGKMRIFYKLPSITIMRADLGHFVNGYLTRLDITPFWPLKL